jgi:hypothetical protein
MALPLISIEFDIHREKKKVACKVKAYYSAVTDTLVPSS